MTHGRSENLVRGLLAVALLLSFGLFGGTCTSNAGRVFSGNNGGGGGDGGGTGGGGGVDPPTPPGPTQALFDGALTLAAAPQALAFAPSNGTTGVDVQSPIAVWFSESVARSSVNIGSLGVRRVEGGGGVNRTVAFYNGDRCAILVPISPLQADTEYEIFATEGLHDLSGSRLIPSVDGVLASFTTASATSGLDPQVVGSFPPAGASNVPHNSDVTVLFSKPVSYESAIANIRVEQVDGSGATLGSAALDAPANSEQGSRVFAYTRTEGADALDLGSRLAVSIDPGVEDTEFNVHTLADPYQAIWRTLSFGPPVSLSTAATPGGKDQALNRALMKAFPLRLDVAGHGLNAGDQVIARIGEVVPGNTSSGTVSVKRSTVLTTAQTGGTPVVFSFNFESSEVGLSQLREGALAVGAFSQRGTARSLVKSLTGIVQDTIPPTLTRFGPPFASSAGTFLTDLPELRPYGTANEPIGVVETSAAGGATVQQSAAEPSSNNWFLGAETTGLTDAQRFSLGTTNFELSLVDSAGNPMLEAITGRVGFRGFVGDTASADAMTVQAIDARSLAPIFACTIQIEAADGSDFRSEVSSLTGQTTFTGLASRDYHVTIQADGYHSATFYGLQSERVSLPLRPIVGGSQTVSPVVSLANANGGELRMASPLLLDADGRGEALAVRDATVPFGFEFGGASVRSDRPGWFAGFFRLSDTDPFSQYALDPRVMVDPYSASTVAAMPALDMIEISAVARVDFPLNFPSVAGNEGITTSAIVTLPGLLGPIPIAAGEDFASGTGASSSTITVVDAMRQAAADYSAEDFADLDVDLIASVSFTGGAGVHARVRDASAAGPNTIVWPSNVPGVFSTGVDPQALAGTPLSFRDSLALDGDVGYYAVVIDDGSKQWDLWVPASLRLLGDPPFPTLDTSPLDDNIDAAWDMFVEAFHMPAGFGEMGFFFRALERDWSIRARSALRTITS